MDRRITDKKFKKLENLNEDKALLMLECVRLILSKNKIDRLDDILQESQQLCDFITGEKK